MKLALALVIFFSFTAHAQEVSWSHPLKCVKTDVNNQCLQEAPDTSITSYRLYYRLVAEDPEICQDEKCSEVPMAKDQELIHNIELPVQTEKYDLETDRAFIRGAMYDIRIAALANNIESLKNDNSVRTTIRGIPEAPHEQVSPGASENGEERDFKKHSRKGEYENETINLGGNYSRGSISAIPQVASRTVDDQLDRGSGERQNRITAKPELDRPVHSLLGEGRHSPTYKRDFIWPTSAEPVGTSRKRIDAVSTSPSETGLGGGRQDLHKNDSGVQGRERNAAGIRPYAASHGPETLRSGTGSAPKVPGDSKDSVIYWVAGIVLLIVIVLAASKKSTPTQGTNA